MKPFTLLALAGATLLAVLLAWSLQREPAGPVGPAEAGQFFLPGLAAQLPEVSAVEIRPAGGEAFRLVQGEAGWQSPAQGGYPVNAGALRRLLLDLSEARVLETKTSNPDLHDRLGVEAEGEEPGSGILLSIEGAPAAPALVIGQRETRGLRGTYVRRLDDPTAVLVDQDLQVFREPVDWLERDLMDIGPEQVEQLEIVRADGETLRIDRDELGIFRIANLPAGRQPSGPTAAETVARALTGLRLDDVAPLAGWSPRGEPDVALFRLRDGLEVEVRSWHTIRPEEGSAWWSAFEVRVAGDADAGAGQRAAELGARLAGWRYRLPAWKHEQLARRLEDLLMPAEP
jgi:hypothetical protein